MATTDDAVERDGFQVKVGDASFSREEAAVAIRSLLDRAKSAEAALAAAQDRQAIIEECLDALNLPHFEKYFLELRQAQTALIAARIAIRDLAEEQGDDQ
jgi:hypothetical protein